MTEAAKMNQSDLQSRQDTVIEVARDKPTPVNPQMRPAVATDNRSVGNGNVSSVAV